MEKHHSESQRQPPSGCIAQLKFKQLKFFTPKKGRPDAGDLIAHTNNSNISKKKKSCQWAVTPSRRKHVLSRFTKAKAYLQV
jgi:hypothetical protein